MLELKRAQSEVVEKPEEGQVIAEVQINFSGGMSLDNVRHFGKGAFVVAAVDELDSRVTHDIAQTAGHSTIRAEERFRQPIAMNRRFDNTLQELPDGTSIHMAELNNPKILNEALKPALVAANSQDLGGGVSRVVVMNVFSTSERPEDFGIKVVPISRNLKKAA